MSQKLPKFITERAIACFLLLVVMCVGFWFRLNACSEPIWLDECHTLWVVDTDLPSVVIDRAAIGNQPPLYFLIAWCVTKVLGLSVFSIRLVSLISGSLLIVIAAIWSQRLTGRWAAAVLVAGLIAFDGQFTFYASESRAYALVQLIGLIQAITFWKLLGRRAGRESSSLGLWGMWITASAGLLYCHYTSIWILISELIVAIAYSISAKSPRFAMQSSLASIFAVATLIPYWWNISLVFERRENWQSVSRLDLLWEDINPWLVHWIMLPAGFGIAWWLLGVIVGVRAEKSTEKVAGWVLPLWLLTWLAIGPIGIAAASWLEIAPMALVRYCVICWVAFALFAGSCLMQFPRSNAWFVGGAIFICSFFGNWWFSDSLKERTLIPFRTEDWGAIARQLDEANTKLPVFQFANVIEDIDAFSIDNAAFQEYLLFPILGAQAIHERNLDLTAEQAFHAMPTMNPEFRTDHLNEVRTARGCWLVVRGEQEFAEFLPCLLEDSLGSKTEFKFLPNKDMPWSQVHLIRVRMIQ